VCFLFFLFILCAQQIATDTCSASNALNYGPHHTHESHAFESPALAEVTEAEEKTVTPTPTASTSPKPAPAPISWLRQAAAEIEAKKGNPNLVARTRQYGRSTALNTSPSPRSYTMGDNVSGKLQQKDFTPEVDGLLPEATALAQVGFACFAPSFTLFLTIAVAFHLGRAAPGGAGEALHSREASKKRASLLVVILPAAPS
jgi:hypothetical protein